MCLVCPHTHVFTAVFWQKVTLKNSKLTTSSKRKRTGFISLLGPDNSMSLLVAIAKTNFYWTIFEVLLLEQFKQIVFL